MPAQFCENRTGNARRRRVLAGNPVIKVGIAFLEQRIQEGEFRCGKSGDMGAGERAENEVHFPGAAMTGAKDQALAFIFGCFMPGHGFKVTLVR